MAKAIRNLSNRKYIYASLFLGLCSCGVSSPEKKDNVAWNTQTVTKEKDSTNIPLPQKDNGDITEFKPSVYNGEVTISLPSLFHLMDQQMLSFKYPNGGQKPEVVYTDDDGTINVALVQTDQEFNADEKYRDMYAKKLSGSAISTVNSALKTINGRTFLIFEFTSAARDTDVYNLMCFTSRGGKLFVATFNCTVAFEQEWKQKARDMLSTLTIKG